METKETVAVRCPQCGSGDITILTEKLGKCNMCGSNVTLPKETSALNVKNEFYVQQGADKDVVYSAIRKEFDQTEFLRNTYLSLASDARTPEDIMSSEFGVVKESCENYLVVEGDACVDYSATIGYDRKEEYKEYNKTTGKYDTKTKTVTDWQAFSGSHRGHYVNAVKNDGENATGGYRFLRAYDSAKPENVVDMKDVDFDIDAPKTPNFAAVEFAKDLICDECKYDAKKSLPGDREKDFSASGTVDVQKIESVSAPVYSIDYKYQGKEIENSSFAFGGYIREGETIDTSQNLMDTVNEKTKLFDLISVIGFSAVSFIMLLVSICDWSKVLLLLPLACIGWKFFTSYNYKKLINNAVEMNQESKKNALVKKLKETNLADLTAEEEKKFVATGNALTPTKHKIRTVGTVLFVVMVVFSVLSIF